MIKSSILAAVIAASPIAAPVVITGCKATQQTVAYKSLASVEAGVSASLNAWADYVVAERKRIAALPPEDQSDASIALADKEGKARAALARYKQAAAVAQVGVNVALANSTAPAPAPLIDAGTEFVSTLNLLK